jgi:hypothetical protein
MFGFTVVGCGFLGDFGGGGGDVITVVWCWW